MRSAAPCGGADVMTRVIDGDGNEKRAERSVPAEAAERVREVDEDIVDQILRGGGIAQ
jgi:hypothetical protein